MVREIGKMRRVMGFYRNREKLSFCANDVYLVCELIHSFAKRPIV